MTPWAPGRLVQSGHYVFQQQTVPQQGPRTVLINGDCGSVLSRVTRKKKPSPFLQQTHLCIYQYICPFIHGSICLFIKQTFTQNIEISEPTDPNRQLFFLSRVECGMVALRSSFYLTQKLLPKGHPRWHLLRTSDIKQLHHLQGCLPTN